MISVKINENNLLDLLVKRVEYWTIDSDVINLFKSMYEREIDVGCFENINLDIKRIVDNDYVNCCDVVRKSQEEFKALEDIYIKRGLGVHSCESDIDVCIEAVDNTCNPTMFLVRG